MMWVKNIRRWTARSLRIMVLAAALVGPASMVIAQAPSATNTNVPRHFARSLRFHLPLKIEAEQRLNLKEVQLWTKTPTTNWKIQETAPPYMEQFICDVPRDGEYWYSLVTVDRSGRSTPADVTNSPPQQRVIVDSTPPAIQVKGCNGPDGSYCIRCTVDDVNVDPTMLKAFCRTPAGEIALEAVPNEPGMFRVNRPEHMKHMVVISATDLAKNTTTKELSVSELLASTMNPAPTSSPTPPTPTPAPTTPITLTTARPDLSSSPSLPPPRGEGPPPLAKSEAQPPAAKVDSPTKTSAVAPSLPERIELPTPPALGNMNSSSTSPPSPAQESPIKLPASADVASRGSAPVQLINTTHASIDYRIDQVGPSGVGKVEIYISPDDGQTWRRHSENLGKRSPAEINLPGDGVFGIRIVTTNGNGFGGKSPVRGDAPHCTIEVDTTSPFVQLRSAEVLPGTGQVEIRWTATDKNLGATPVKLYYRPQADGPWQTLAHDLKNDGIHRWTFPRNASTQFFFKIEVTDMAGNISEHSTPQAVVIDTTEPRAVVVGVTGSARP